ncbi:hypothetical protein [Demequina activiva]|uniref:Uncharacterized protein n=1 Tax=Demequina activiva TaxID=1582364 RepID=A0A919Q6L8_9MICO|nr:hypothetical protein [Demequina activiva]GIG55508.1 hypothetical protein Dac01nite_22600 [Demequina activiva]
MELYSGLIYPAVLVWCAVLAATGIVTMVWVRAHRVLQGVVTGMWIVTAIQLVTVLVLLISGNDAGIVLTLGYLLASVALIPLLGIGRLGAPDAAALDPDPNRPVLQPDQIARVDGGAALIIAIAAAVLAWRVAVLLGAA